MSAEIILHVFSTLLKVSHNNISDIKSHLMDRIHDQIIRDKITSVKALSYRILFRQRHGLTKLNRKRVNRVSLQHP